MPEWITQTEAAGRINITKQSFGKHVLNGKIPRNRDGYVDWEFVQPYFANLSDEARAKGGKEPIEVDPEIVKTRETFNKAKAHEALFKAKDRELNYQIKAGKFVRADEVEAEMRRLSKRLSTALEQIPERMAARLVGLRVEEIRAVMVKDLTKLIDELRGELKDDLAAEAADG